MGRLNRREVTVPGGRMPVWTRNGTLVKPSSSAIEVSVALLAGQHDLIDPPETLEANLIPVIRTARMAVIEATGHLSPLEVPDPVANQISIRRRSRTRSR
jgi:pimeloyl-ACP methyl ester carboxylesterase